MGEATTYLKITKSEHAHGAAADEGGDIVVGEAGTDG